VGFIIFEGCASCHLHPEVQNSQSKINQAICALPCKLRLLLTGTPIQNDLSGQLSCHWRCVLHKQDVPLKNIGVYRSSGNACFTSELTLMISPLHSP
jgi:hypothetical protein